MEELITWEGQTSDGVHTWSVRGTLDHFEELLTSLQAFVGEARS